MDKSVVSFAWGSWSRTLIPSTLLSLVKEDFGAIVVRQSHMIQRLVDMVVDVLRLAVASRKCTPCAPSVLKVVNSTVRMHALHTAPLHILGVCMVK
eukprot:561454-Amphidinium_carterae.1